MKFSEGVPDKKEQIPEVKPRFSLKDVFRRAEIKRDSRQIIQAYSITPSSEAERSKILQALYPLGIFPWEEDGKLIIEHAKDVQKVAEKKLLSLEPESNQEQTPPYKGRNEFSFPMQDYGRTPLFPTKSAQTTPTVEKKINESLPEISEEEREAEVQPVDYQIHTAINNFDSGRLDWDDEELIKAAGYIPHLALFPHRYQFEKNTTRDLVANKIYSKEDRLELIRLAQEGDDKALDTMLKMSVGLVLHVLPEIRNRYGGNADTLFQAGLIGLWQAIQKHDPEKGAFSTYAIMRIDSAMRRSLTNERDQDVIFLPVYAKEQRGKAQRVERRFESENARLPTAEELAKELEVPVEKVHKIQKTYGFTPANYIPIEEVEGEPEQLISPDNTDAELMTSALREKINEVVFALTPREQAVIRLRFGLSRLAPMNPEDLIPIFNNYGQKSEQKMERVREIAALIQEGKEVKAQDNFDADVLFLLGKRPEEVDQERSLEQVGEFIGVSRERIRQLETHGLRTIKHPARIKQLRSFIEIREQTRPTWKWLNNEGR